MVSKDIYPTHSLGEHIIPFELVFGKHETVESTIAEVQKMKGSWPNSENIYVVDADGKLVGEIPFNLLLAAPKKSKLEVIMNKKFESLTSHSHQSTAVAMAIKQGIASIPVVDRELHFLGIIDAGAIFKIMHEEHIEKLMHFSGILNTGNYTDMLKEKTSQLVKERIPWLLFGLMGGILATLIVEKFEFVLQEVVTLAFFIPVIVYISSAVGTQTQTIYVRLSALERVPFKKYFIQQFKITLLLSVILAFAMFAFIGLWFGDIPVAFVVGLSMLAGIVSSVFIGTFFPWFLQKIGKDPAIGSGPFTTIIQDLLSIVIYFTIATVLL